MKDKKRKLTPEELSQIRSAAGKKGAASLLKSKNFRGGRPKGSPNKNPSGVELCHSILVRESAYKVFVKCAGFINKSLVEFMGIVAEGLKKKNPQLFELHDQVRV